MGLIQNVTTEKKIGTAIFFVLLYIILIITGILLIVYGDTLPYIGAGIACLVNLVIFLVFIINGMSNVLGERTKEFLSIGYPVSIVIIAIILFIVGGILEATNNSYSSALLGSGIGILISGGIVFGLTVIVVECFYVTEPSCFS